MVFHQDFLLCLRKVYPIQKIFKQSVVVLSQCIGVGGCIFPPLKQSSREQKRDPVIYRGYYAGLRFERSEKFSITSLKGLL